MGNPRFPAGKSAVFLGVILSLSAGCQPGGSVIPEPLPDRSDTLNILYPAEPVSLDPSVSLDSYAAVILDHTFERLVRLDQSGEIVPAAAVRWTVSPDGKVYTFTLRPGARWSDGRPVTAEDFRSSWLRLLDPKNKFPHATKLTPYIVNADAYAKGLVGADKVGIQAADDHTLVVELNNPTSFFLQIITYWSFAPLRMDVLHRAGAGWSTEVGTNLANGPYRMAEYQKGDHVLLVRNPFYWNRPSVRIPGIRVFFQKPDQDPFTLFRNGEMDCISNVQASDIPSVPDLQPELHIDQALGTMMVFVNHQNPVLAALRFRDALSESVDRQKLVDEVVNKAGTPSRFLIPPSLVLAGQKFHDFTALNPASDQPRLAALVREARASARAKPLRLYFKTGSLAERIAKILVAEWKSTLGIEVIPTGMDWQKLVGQCQKGDYDLALMSYSAEYPHPMSFLGQFLPNGPCTVFTHWSDPEFQRRLADASAVQDDGKSLEVLRQLETRIIDEYHVIPLYYTRVICLMADRVSGWYRNGIGQTSFTFDRAYLH